MFVVAEREEFILISVLDSNRKEGIQVAWEEACQTASDLAFKHTDKLVFLDTIFVPYEWCSYVNMGRYTRFMVGKHEKDLFFEDEDTYSLSWEFTEFDGIRGEVERDITKLADEIMLEFIQNEKLDPKYVLSLLNTIKGLEQDVILRQEHVEGRELLEDDYDYDWDVFEEGVL